MYQTNQQQQQNKIKQQKDITYKTYSRKKKINTKIERAPKKMEENVGKKNFFSGFIDIIFYVHKCICEWVCVCLCGGIFGRVNFYIIIIKQVKNETIFMYGLTYINI